MKKRSILSAILALAMLLTSVPFGWTSATAEQLELVETIMEQATQAPTEAPTAAPTAAPTEVPT